jgi:hypothetical protein
LSSPERSEVPLRWDERVDGLLRSLVDALGSAAELAEEPALAPQERAWLLRPASRDASPVWVTATTDGTEEFTVGFGWDTPGPRIEPGAQARERADVDPLVDLREICEAIINGCLVEEVKRRPWDGPDEAGASRWELTMPDGRTLRGSHGWMLPRMPWTSTSARSYRPYR